VSIKPFIAISTLILQGCTISGNYNYSNEGISEKHQNEIVFVYSGKINNTDYKIYNKINHDPTYTDKAPYYETSYEIWFW
jgi:hypothetical protein